MYKLTKDEYDSLPEGFKAKYKQDGDNYVLVEVKTTGVTEEEMTVLRRGKDRETQAAKELRAKLKEIEDKLALETDDDARKKGDIATLDKSWQAKLEAQKEDYEKRLSGKDKHLTKAYLDDVANTIANSISTKPNVMLPHIKSRLSVDLSEDTPLTRVLDKDGKLSSQSIDELKEEFRTNDDFSGIVKASNASGGGAGGNQGGNGGAKSLSEMNADEEAAFANKNPKAYDAMVAAEEVG